MMVHEFEERIKGSIPESDYMVVEFVYTWHPAIKDKDGIANLYTSLGMTVIRDMLPRAERAKALDEELRIAQRSVEEIQEKIRENNQ